MQSIEMPSVDGELLYMSCEPETIIVQVCVHNKGHYLLLGAIIMVAITEIALTPCHQNRCKLQLFLTGIILQ